MKINLSSIFKKPSTMAVFSIVLAVVSWYVVVYSISPTDDKELVGVPVQINLPATSDLNIVEGGDTTVTVKVEGMRYNIGNLAPEEVHLRAVLTNVSRPGNYDLKIEAVKPLNDRYEVISIYPESINVTFDREITRELLIEQHITGVSVPDEGYLLGDISIEPGKVTVQGPEKDVERIARAMVKTELTEPFTTSETLTLPIVFLDAYGEEIKTKANGGYISTSYDTTTVHIPVLEVVELPLTVSFVNVPDEFPLEELEYTLSNDTITVAATSDIIGRYYEVPVGHIDLSQLDLVKNSSITFDVELPDNVVNYNNIENIVVEFDVNGLSAKTMKLKNISTLNVPPEYNVSIKSNTISNVRLIGDKKVLDTVLPDGVVAEIDFSLQELTVGQYPVAVRIYMPTND
ncbi:MAG: CdaR family protein, partial [Angelakisella sp.]